VAASAAAVAASAAAVAASAAVEGDSSAAAVALAVEGDSSAILLDSLSLNISYKQLAKSILVTATNNSNMMTHSKNKQTKEQIRTKKTNRQYVSTQQLTLLDTASAASTQTSVRMG
jgi:hypothetical protein